MKALKIFIFAFITTISGASCYYLYPNICQSNSTNCFSMVASQWSIGIFSVGLLIKHIRNLFEKDSANILGKLAEKPQPIAALFYFMAIGWFSGAILHFNK